MARQSDRDEDTGASTAVPSEGQLAGIAKALVHTRERVQATIHASSQQGGPMARSSYLHASEAAPGFNITHPGGGIVRIEATAPAEPAAPRGNLFVSEGYTEYRYALDDKVELVIAGAEGDRMYATVRTEPLANRERFDIDMNISLSGIDAFEATTLKRLLTEKLRSFLAAAREENADRRIAQLVQAIAPEDPLADVELRVAENTVALRREFIERVPVLTSADVHRNAGFPGSNPSQTVLRWRRSGKIFGINHGGRDLYPAFQFGRDGRPLPMVAEVLAILKRDPERSDWDHALWFAGDTGWLDGKSPIECLQTDPESVKRAAEQEALRDEC